MHCATAISGRRLADTGEAIRSDRGRRRHQRPGRRAFLSRAHRRQARILILDNHDDFGGHAKRNEFNLDGQLNLMNGGTLEIEAHGPTVRSPRAADDARHRRRPNSSRRLENLEFYEHLGLQQRRVLRPRNLRRRQAGGRASTPSPWQATAGRRAAVGRGARRPSYGSRGQDRLYARPVIRREEAAPVAHELSRIICAIWCNAEPRGARFLPRRTHG